MEPLVSDWSEYPHVTKVSILTLSFVHDPEMTLTMLLSEKSLVLQMGRVEEEFPSIRYKAVQVYTVTYPMLDIK